MTTALHAATLLSLALAAPPQQQVPSPAPGEPVRGDPPSQQILPQRFVLLGDFGTTAPEAFEVAAMVRALEPDFVLTLGDNNYPDGKASTIDANIGQHYHEFIHPYKGAYGPGALRNRFFPTLGNHDWRASGARPYLDYFELPGNERYYDFRFGDVHFFALDSDPHEPDGNTVDSLQAAWLERRLRASDAAFKMVFMHHPPYGSSDHHGANPDLQWPFQEWGASIVLSGHDHLYERLTVDGFPYIVNGLGGRNVYEFAAPVGGSETRFNAEHGALYVVADSEFARFRFLTSSGTIQDDFVLPRGGIERELVTLVAEDALWAYRDTGVDPGPGWRVPGFDDSTWTRGRAQLGYGEGDEATVVSYGGVSSARHVTTWFRRAFAVDPAELDSLQLRLLVDDGAVVYLNGTEVLRVRMPEGAITADTLASAGASGAEETTFVPLDLPTDALLDLAPGQLSRGLNVLAVEVHQASPGSNDVSFAAELVGVPRGPILLSRGSFWRYRDDASPLGDAAATWHLSGFDDSSWKRGRAQLGYGESDQRTTLASGAPTAYFRATFDVTDASAVRWLSCRMLRDDGVIVYLNGEEALRMNLPLVGVTHDTRAPFNVGQESENRIEGHSLDPRLLVDGTNTIAVEVHQSVQTNPDLSFDLELAGH